ncbi:DUF2169 family type VI secretion system accessory protein [Nannocystis exedens]|uniref:DUF2169 family type VI secretion system accessory protein n=1 Tax=Nannocystis exedens TaxID=54 RepID=UPI001474CA0D|nr:DUF2169 domain-containing protein [Nannocystis exedens]
MFTLTNRTPCQVHTQLVLDPRAEEHLLVLAKASFSIEAGQLVSAEAELVLADRYRGDPTASSLVAAGEVVLAKPLPDLLLSGNAYPSEPGGTTGHVSFRVGAWSKDALIFGDRTWTRGITGLSPGAPQPFETVPLIYERAFGGAGLDGRPPLECAENPVGVGLVGCQAGAPLPNLEHPRHRLAAPGDRPPPRSFGPIPPHWGPRRGLHGTLDAAWQRTRLPLPPLDGDPRAAQVAPPDQVYPTMLRGDEEVEIRGVQPGGAWLTFRLPSMHVQVIVHDGKHRRALPTVLDTLHVDAEARRLDLTWRASTSVHERFDELAWVLVDRTGGPSA